MRNLSILITLDQQEPDYNAFLLNYRIASNFADDQWGAPRLLARQATACGWQSGGVPLLLGRKPATPAAHPVAYLPGRQGSRLSVDGRWLWKPHPQAPWPAPHRILQIDRRHSSAEVVWDRDGWEILDLQLDPQGAGLYFAVRHPGGPGQLWHWCPRSRRATVLVDNSDFHPIEFALHPSGAGLAFVHQQDDQLYYHGFGSRFLRQLSQPNREQESPEGHGVYRCSPAYSADGTRIFYCTAFLEMQAGNLCNWGHLYVSPDAGGKLRHICLEDEGCPVNLCLPSPAVQAGLAIAS